MSPSMEGEVRAELARIVASDPFRNADSARRFLAFVVEEKLAGRAGAIKEFVIGREVFARGDDFDPRIDPVARVQAGKLRTKLKEYYDGPGTDAPLIIDLPKGTYVPEFRYTDHSSGPASKPGRPPLRMAIAAVAAGVACVAVGYWLGRSKQVAGDNGVFQLSVPLPSGFTRVAWPVISPDGRWVVFAAREDDKDWRLWLVDLTSQAMRPVAGTESGSYPFWSPDSRSIGFADLDKGLLLKVPVEGGVAQQLAEGLQWRCRGASLNAKGELLFGESEGPLWWIGSGGSAPRAVTSLDQRAGESSHRFPVFLPDGHRFLYLAVTPSSATGAIYAGDTRSGVRTKITTSDSNAFLSGGSLYFVQGGKLVSRRFDPDSLKLAGDAVPVTSDLEFSPDLHVGWFSVSNAGVLVWNPTQWQHQLVWVDRSGRKVEVIDRRGKFEQVSLARASGRLAATILDAAAAARDVWSFDLARHTVTRETHQPGWRTHAVLSPDGNRMVLSMDRGSGLELFLRDVASTHPDQPLLPHAGLHRFATDWSRDGKSVLFTQRSPKTARDIWIVSMEGSRVARPLLATSYNECEAQFSPDGRWIAYTSDDSGAAQVWVMPIDGGQRRQMSLNGGMEPRWRADGRELFFISLSGMLSSVEIRTEPAWQAGQPRELFRCSPPRRLEWTSGTGYDVSNDGARFVMAESEVRNAGFMVRVAGR